MPFIAKILRSKFTNIGTAEWACQEKDVKQGYHFDHIEEISAKSCIDIHRLTQDVNIGQSRIT